MYAYLEMSVRGGGEGGGEGLTWKKWQIPDICRGGGKGTLGIDCAKLSQFDLLC